MATSYYGPSALPYRPTTAINNSVPAGLGYSNESDPRKLAANQRGYVAGQGAALINSDTDLANQYRQQSEDTQGYLHNLMDPLAQGAGGYSADEVRQIQLNPDLAKQIQLNPELAKQIQFSQQDKNNLIQGAGITAGANTAASVAAAERAAAAAGGNPAALAEYRARAAQQMASQGSDAMTKARGEAKQLESQGAQATQQLQSQGAQAAQQLQSQGAQATGNARLGQQNKGLDYYSGLQSQQNQAAQNEQGLAQGAYGTQTAGTNAAADLGFKASQTPTTTDKVISTIGGIAKGLAFLADGEVGPGQEAVLGEDGPEVIVKAASAPVRNQHFMADGGNLGTISQGPDNPYVMTDLPMQTPDYGGMDPATKMEPWWKRAAQKDGALDNYLKSSQMQSAKPAQESFNPTKNYSDLGQGIGSIAASIFKADGQPQLITSPTRVRLQPDEAVVPLSFRPRAKVRPSAALPAIARMRQNFGAARA